MVLFDYGNRINSNDENQNSVFQVQDDSDGEEQWTENVRKEKDEIKDNIDCKRIGKWDDRSRSRRIHNLQTSFVKFVNTFFFETKKCHSSSFHHLFKAGRSKSGIPKARVDKVLPHDEHLNRKYSAKMKYIICTT